MGYRIIYGAEPERNPDTKDNSLRLRTMIAGCLLAFALIVKCFWPEGTALLTRAMLPTQVSQTQAAMERLITDLGRGQAFEDAFTVFCREIIKDGKIH